MKGSFILILVFFALAACAERWQKPGASDQDFAAIDSVCRGRANVRFPPLYRYVLDGGRYRLPFIVAYCDRDNPAAPCRTPQGDYVFPSMVESDSNLGARWNDYHACLSEHGWQQV
jgi:hypothetical protein